MTKKLHYCTYPDFLSEDDRNICLDHVLTNKVQFRPSRVNAKIDEAAVRQSSSLADFGPCLDIMRSAVKPMLPQFAQTLGVDFYEFKNFDASLVAHNEGAFYKPHIDIGITPEHRSRVISAVYYFYRAPKGFTGGDLRLFDIGASGSFTDIEPRDNSLVVFLAMTPHEVRPVRCRSGAFEDSRFALNVWAHRKTSR